MDVTQIAQLIQTQGFPICMCLLLMWYINKSSKSHAEEVDRLREAINNNTNVMIQLSERLNREAE